MTEAQYQREVRRITHQRGQPMTRTRVFKEDGTWYFRCTCRGYELPTTGSHTWFVEYQAARLHQWLHHNKEKTDEHHSPAV